MAILRKFLDAAKRFFSLVQRPVIEHGIVIQVHSPWTVAGSYDVSYDVGYGYGEQHVRAWYYIGRVNDVRTGKERSFLRGPFKYMNDACAMAQEWADEEADRLVDLGLGVA